MWYHVRREFAGKSPTITPLIPRAAEDYNWCRSEEGDIPRICVSDVIINCLRGIMGISNPAMGDFRKYFHENPHLYITEETPFMPPNCLDFRENNEHWFITPTKFIYLGRIDMYKLFRGSKIGITTEKKIKFVRTNKYILHPDKIKSTIIEDILRGKINVNSIRANNSNS